MNYDEKKTLGDQFLEDVGKKVHVKQLIPNSYIEYVGRVEDNDVANFRQCCRSGHFYDLAKRWEEVDERRYCY